MTRTTLAASNQGSGPGPSTLCLVVLLLLVGSSSKSSGGLMVDSLDPQLLTEGESAGNWRWMPDFIRGSEIHSVNAGHPAGIAGGAISFTVTSPETLFLAAHYGYEGNPSGGWTLTRTTRAELEADGWAYRGDMKNQDARVYRLFEKDVDAGQYDLRVNKYSPPLLITTTSQTGTLPSNETPWPTFGPLSMSEFDPIELQETTTPGDGFTYVPEALRGKNIFSEERRPHNGELEFRVHENTTVYLAGHFGYEGNNEGDWDDDRLTQSDLLNLGWTYVDFMTRHDGRQFDVYQRNVYAGEEYRLRVNKYTAPLLISDLHTADPEPLGLEAGMYEAQPGESIIVDISVETDKDLTSVNPAIALNNVIGMGDATITDGSGTAGGFWDGQPTTVTDLLEAGQTAGKFNVSLEIAGESATGTGDVVSFEVTVPPDANVGDKWSIDFLTGATGSTWSELGGSTAETEFSGLTSGMIFIVPEPSTFGVFLVGVFLIAWRRKRKA